MLTRLEATSPVRDRSGPLADGAFGSALDLDRLLAAARRQAVVVIASAVIAAIFGLAFVVAAVPRYTATALILIDTRKAGAVEQSRELQDLVFETGAIDSQVEVLKSETIAQAVIESRKLLDDPRFWDESSERGEQIKTALRAALTPILGSAAEPSEEETRLALQRSALRKIASSLEVKRLARTYVLSIEFTHRSPALAASIANGFADAYLVDQLNSKYDATRRASTWLEERIQELREKSLQTDLAVQRFRAQNNLVASDGRLISDQQLSELNSQLIVARGETAKAEARYNRIRSIISTGDTDAAVSEALGNSVINDLRTRFLRASKSSAELSARLGSNHVQVINLRAEMREYTRLIFEELTRISESYRSDFEISKAKEKQLTEDVAGLVGVAAVANETLVTLRELERESQSYKTLYQNFLQRFQEMTQQQSFPVTEARVITAATPPDSPSYPRKTLVVALAFILGGVLGCGVGAFREFKDRVFRTGDQVQESLDHEFLGMLPAMPPDALGSRLPTALGHDLRVPGSISPAMRYALDNPFSGFAETMRSAKVAIDLSLPDKHPKIIGIVSLLPGEGKSTTAKNFATLLAHLGARALLIDGDLRTPGLSRAVCSNADSGLLEVLLGERTLAESLVTEPDSGLAVLPVVVRRRVTHTSELMSSNAMRSLLAQASSSYEYIVVDLPPLGPVVDVRAFAAFVDKFVMVIEWGKTARTVVRNSLVQHPEVDEKIVGVILNKVDANKLKMYTYDGDKEYYHSRFSSYYTEK